MSPELIQAIIVAVLGSQVLVEVVRAAVTRFRAHFDAQTKARTRDGTELAHIRADQWQMIRDERAARMTEVAELRAEVGVLRADLMQAQLALAVCERARVVAMGEIEALKHRLDHHEHLVGNDDDQGQTEE